MRLRTVRKAPPFRTEDFPESCAECAQAPARTSSSRRPPPRHSLCASDQDYTVPVGSSDCPDQSPPLFRSPRAVQLQNFSPTSRPLKSVPRIHGRECTDKRHSNYDRRSTCADRSRTRRLRQLRAGHHHLRWSGRELPGVRRCKASGRKSQRLVGWRRSSSVRFIIRFHLLHVILQRAEYICAVKERMTDCDKLRAHLHRLHGIARAKCPEAHWNID